MKPRRKDPTLTILAPVFNEEEAIEPFVAAVDQVIQAHGLKASYLFVNDGSSDGTFDVLLRLHQSRPDIQVIDLSRNFGKEAALTAGLDFADSDAVVVIDIDLQDPPEVIVSMIAEWKKGYDNVFGVRVKRATDTLAKRATAAGFYWAINRISRDRIPSNAGDFRLLDRSVVEALRRLPERNRFMKGLFAWVGFPSTGVPYERSPRMVGKTKFNYFKLWNFALDGMISFSTAPLKVWMYVGVAAAAAALLYGGMLVLNVLIRGVDVPGYASVMVAVLFFSSLNLISLGLMGEYIGRLFMEAKGRPVYMVQRALGDWARTEARPGKLDPDALAALEPAGYGRLADEERSYRRRGAPAPG